MKFKYTVEGDYITKDGYQGSYESDFVLDTPTISEARAVIQNSLISAKLKTELEDYKRWKTCQVTDQEEVYKNTKSSIDKELEELTIEATDSGCIPTTLTSLKTDEAKKKALKKALEGHKKRQAKAEEKEKKSGVRIEKID